MSLLARARIPWRAHSSSTNLIRIGRRTPAAPMRSSCSGVNRKRYASTDALPTIIQPSFWRSMVPRSLRSDPQAATLTEKPKSKEWNPATFFIVIFMLIGSQGIQTISLQRHFDQFSNHTEAKLSLLREVVYRVKNGEDVDVEGLLGTGDAKREKEWEEGRPQIRKSWVCRG